MTLVLIKIFFFVLCTTIIGTRLNRKYLDSTYHNLVVPMSFMTGMAAVFLIALLSFALRIQLEYLLAVGALCSFRPQEKKDILLASMLFSLVASGFFLSKFTFLSYDSYYINFIGKALANENPWSLDLRRQLSLWGIFALTIQSFSSFFNVEMVNFIQPTISISFLISFITLTQKYAKNALLTIALLASPIYLFQILYIHNNMIASAYLCIATLLLFESTTNSKMIIPLSYLVIFSFVRIEAPIFIVATLYILRRYNPDLHKQSRSLAIALVVAVAWNLFLLFNIGEGDSLIATPKRFIAMILILILYICESHIFTRFEKKKTLLFSISCVGALMLVLFKNQHIILQSIFNMAKNLLMFDIWGLTWYLAIASLIFVLIFKPRNNFSRFSFEFIFIYLVVLATLAIFRDKPYVVGWADSANRIATQVFPILIITISDSIDYASVLLSKNSKRS